MLVAAEWSSYISSQEVRWISLLVVLVALETTTTTVDLISHSFSIPQDSDTTVHNKFQFNYHCLFVFYNSWILPIEFFSNSVSQGVFAWALRHGALTMRSQTTLLEINELIYRVLYPIFDQKHVIQLVSLFCSSLKIWRACVSRVRSAGSWVHRSVSSIAHLPHRTPVSRDQSKLDFHKSAS